MSRGGAQSDDSCIKFSASPSSSEYNAPIHERQPLNICDVLPPPPDHPYGAYKPPNSMTIRTNPVAMSPQICRRTGIPQSRWPTLPAQGYTPNWQTNNQQTYPINQSNQNINEMEEENDYESGSVLYEQCMRPDADMQASRNYFNYGEPTEEYYRNINMEFLDENLFDGHTSPPEPCPDTLPKNRNKHINLPNKFVNPSWQQHQQQQQQQQPQPSQQSPEMHGSDDRTATVNESSPVNGRRTIRNQVNGTVCGRSAHSSEESESDNNRWPRQDSMASRARRTRSKSGDRKFRTGFAR